MIDPLISESNIIGTTNKRNNININTKVKKNKKT